MEMSVEVPEREPLNILEESIKIHDYQLFRTKISRWREGQDKEIYKE